MADAQWNLAWAKKGMYWFSVLRNALVKLALGFARSRCSTYIFRDLLSLYLVVFCLLCWVRFWVSAPIQWHRWLLANPNLCSTNLITQMERVSYILLSHSPKAACTRPCLGQRSIYEPITMILDGWLRYWLGGEGGCVWGLFCCHLDCKAWEWGRVVPQRKIGC